MQAWPAPTEMHVHVYIRLGTGTGCFERIAALQAALRL